MQEMDAKAVDDGTELADLVEATFERPPVVRSLPVLHKFHDVGEGRALVPSVAAPNTLTRGLAFGEACRCETCPQLRQLFLRGTRLEEFDAVVGRVVEHGWSPLVRTAENRLRRF
ncbi:hypothetical protein SRABI128_03218 [Microbacterium sp. Bi128]|nr:hypothetical protein SRABI128_03218 [Microbacterium sp. Bi128]